MSRSSIFSLARFSRQPGLGQCQTQLHEAALELDLLQHRLQQDQALDWEVMLLGCRVEVQELRDKELEVHGAGGIRGVNFLSEQQSSVYYPPASCNVVSTNMGPVPIGTYIEIRSGWSSGEASRLQAWILKSREVGNKEGLLNLIRTDPLSAD